MTSKSETKVTEKQPEPAKAPERDYAQDIANVSEALDRALQRIDVLERLVAKLVPNGDWVTAVLSA